MKMYVLYGMVAFWANGLFCSGIVQDQLNVDFAECKAILNEEGHVGEPHFVIVSASYNNKEWYKKNLDSVFSQTFPWKLIYIDDASKDGTADLVAQYVKNQAPEIQSRVLLVRNKENRDKLANVYDAIHSCDPHDIIVMLDADDWFIDRTVLEYLRDIYKNSDVWLTYGQYVGWPNPAQTQCYELPREVIAHGSVRSYYPFVTSHLKTFYAELFQKIRREDLMWNGRFVPYVDDVAFMFPMVEMAGFHSHFIAKPLYVFNELNSTMHTNAIVAKTGNLKWVIENHLRMQKAYEKIM